MPTNVKNTNSKRTFLPVERAASKTARKFKSPFAYDELPQAVSVSLDWLSMMVNCAMPEPAPGQEPIFRNEDIVLHYMNRGTQTFKHSWQVFSMGEHVANLHTHSRNEKIIDGGTAKLEITNNVLYSTEVDTVVSDVFDACLIHSIRNLTRVDIAMDGMNHIHKFLNCYISQGKSRAYPTLQRIGKWSDEHRVRMKGKARIHAKMFNTGTGLFDNFSFGSSRKRITVYEKKQELDRSGKEYIRDGWARAGLNTDGDVWRVELQLSSEAIKDIKDFGMTDGKIDFKKLQFPGYLLQVFKTSCANFFEFVDMGEQGAYDVSRAPVIDLFQFEMLRIPILQKVARGVIDGAYKAKMSIHNAVKDVYHNLHYTQQSINAALIHITDNLRIYNLYRWYERKKLDWEIMYRQRVFDASNEGFVNVALGLP